MHPSHLHFPYYCNTIARLLRNMRRPPDPPCVCITPYNIGDGNIVSRPTGVDSGAKVCTRISALDVTYPGMYPGMRGYVPSARGYALHTLGPGYGEMYTHTTLKKNYNFTPYSGTYPFAYPIPCPGGYEGMGYGTSKISAPLLWRVALVGKAVKLVSTPSEVSLYTILSLPILYGV